MSPEAIEFPNSVDARSDLYAMGAVGYFLLTGQSVFEAASVLELCQMHLDRAPVPPSERVDVKIPAELESALLACLEKSRAKRPQTARDLAALNARCAEANSWSIEDSDAWWGRHERREASGLGSSPTPPPPARTNTPRHDVTIDQPR
jgi:serine/threonine protein kinase